MAKDQAAAAGVGGGVKFRKCTSCNAKKPETVFTIGKVTCDRCCIKKPKTSKERTKQKLSFQATAKATIEEVRAKNATLEEENRILRTKRPRGDVHEAATQQVSQAERQNQILRQLISGLQSEIVEHQDRFERTKALVGQEVPALLPQLDAIPDQALRDSQGRTEAEHEELRWMDMLCPVQPLTTPTAAGGFSPSPSDPLHQMFLSEEQALVEMSLSSVVTEIGMQTQDHPAFMDL